jgi:hypothetical protein
MSTTLKAGDVTTIFVNQGERDCSLLEIHEHYNLGIYIMPAGRAFLTRIMPEGRLSRPTKAERDRYTKEVLEAELAYTYDLEDAAHDMRSGRKQRQAMKEALASRTRLIGLLKALVMPYAKNRSLKHAGGTFTADWLNADRTRLSITTPDVVEDANGVDRTDWPTDEQVSRLVGMEVQFHDSGDNPKLAEAIYHTVSK